jgi:hypothetical protein
MELSMGEKVRYSLFCQHKLEIWEEKIAKVVELPKEDKARRKFVFNFINTAITAKLAELSQEGE